MTGQEKTTVLRALSDLLVRIKEVEELTYDHGCIEDIGKHLHRALYSTHNALAVFMSSYEKEKPS